MPIILNKSHFDQIELYDKLKSENLGENEGNDSEKTDKNVSIY